MTVSLIVAEVFVHLFTLVVVVVVVVIVVFSPQYAIITRWYCISSRVLRWYSHTGTLSCWWCAVYVTFTFKVIGLDSSSRQVFIYLDPFLIYISP